MSEKAIEHDLPVHLPAIKIRRTHTCPYCGNVYDSNKERQNHIDWAHPDSVPGRIASLDEFTPFIEAHK